MIGVTHIKVYPHAAGSVGGNQDVSRTKGGSIPRYTWPWMRIVCRSESFVTAGTVADCTYGEKLVEGIDAAALFADRGYDVNKLIESAKAGGMKIVIPPKKNRIEQREYDKYLYGLRHLIKNAFLALKRWRAILLVTLKTPHHSWRQFRFVALPFGLASIDDTI